LVLYVVWVLLLYHISNTLQTISQSNSRHSKRSRREKGYLLHQYFKRKGHYRFVGGGLLKLALALVILGVLVWVFNTYVFDVQAALNALFERFNYWGILAVFFASESFLGLVPIDVFIAWGAHEPNPVVTTAFLALLSYAGGIISFFEGRLIGRSQKVQAFMLRKYQKLWQTFLKFGWLFVSVAAITPIPFAPVSIIAGMLGMGKKYFFLAALTRIARFGLYAFVFFKLLA
jgi:membrane protein YqaA with SNARE-associated domain